MNSRVKEFKNQLNERAVYGLFSKTCDPGFVEAAGYAGFDFIIPDLEHGPISIENLQNIIRASEVSGITPIVRVKEGNYTMIGEVLDLGVKGVQVPQIIDSISAKKAIEHSKFSPKGKRGICRFVRAAKYSSLDRFEYFDESNGNIVVLQLEGTEAIRNIDEILSIDGIDIVFIGPYDLSQSLGVKGEVNHPLVEEKMLEIIRKCEEYNVSVGTFVDSLENAGKWEKLGIKYIAYSVDMGLFYDMCKNITDKLKR